MGIFDEVPAERRAAAPFVAGGAFLSILGLPIALAADVLSGVDTDPQPLAVLGLVLVAVGAVLLAVGLYRQVARADRAAGVRAAAVEVAVGADAGDAPKGG